MTISLDVTQMIFIVLYSGLFFWLDYKHRQEKDELLDRLMAKDYQEFSMRRNQKKFTPTFRKTKPVLTDEEMLAQERDRNSEKLNEHKTILAHTAQEN